MIVKTAQDEIVNYLVDAANVKGFCDAVYFPENENDVIEVVKEAYRNNIKVTVSGNGTGLAGGRVPRGGIVIATDKLNKVLEINIDEKFAVLQPGVILKDFQEAVEEKGLFYPPDPTERNCFVGATIATNSSGAKTFKYGPTRNYVLEMRIILPDGDALYLKRGLQKAVGNKLSLTTESGRVIDVTIPEFKMPDVKHAAGYYCKPGMDAIDLFIGSEGTFGIITLMKVKLINLPENILSSVIFFNEEDDALAFIDEARSISYETRRSNTPAEVDAQGLEFFDYYALQLLKEEYPQVPEDAKAAVWFEQEITDETEEPLFEKWMELIARHNGNEETAWFASNKNEREKFKDFRHSISWKVSDYISKKNITKVGTDIAVPDYEFYNFYKDIKSEVEKNNIEYVAYGHLGNSHLHLNMLPKDQAEHALAKKIYAQICEKAVDAGGTISAEHGVGKLKTDYLLKMYGENIIKEMAELKLTFDPKGILSVGNMFEEKYLK
jgi:D-lactate dehydrogenase (cytochrome)